MISFITSLVFSGSCFSLWMSRWRFMLLHHNPNREDAVLISLFFLFVLSVCPTVLSLPVSIFVSLPWPVTFDILAGCCLNVLSGFTLICLRQQCTTIPNKTQLWLGEDIPHQPQCMWKAQSVYANNDTTAVYPNLTTHFHLDLCVIMACRRFVMMMVGLTNIYSCLIPIFE